MLEQMERIVESEKPDVFLLSGDVYHTTQPSSATQTMFTNAMVRIHEAHPDMVIVVTAGNHDSGAKHDIFQTPWRALKVFTVGTLEKEQPDNHIIHIEGKGYVVAIPYSYERNIPDGFFQGLLDEVSRRNTGNLPVVMMAHTTIKGCDFTGHDMIIWHWDTFTMHNSYMEENIVYAIAVRHLPLVSTRPTSIAFPSSTSMHTEHRQK